VVVPQVIASTTTLPWSCGTSPVGLSLTRRKSLLRHMRKRVRRRPGQRPRIRKQSGRFVSTEKATETICWPLSFIKTAFPNRPSHSPQTTQASGEKPATLFTCCRQSVQSRFYCWCKIAFATYLLPLRQKSLNKSRIKISSAKIRIRQDFPVQRDCGVNAFDDKHSQGAAHTLDGFVAIFAAYY
jgi:hypothetical protein